MQKIQPPANIDALTELGRTATDDTLFIHFADGTFCRQNRRTTCCEWFAIDADELPGIRQQYQTRSNFIRH